MKAIVQLLIAALLLTFVPFQNGAQTNSKLNYLIRSPKIKQVSPPLLILLHGVGSNEQDLFSMEATLPPEYLVVSLRAPNTLSEGSYAWFQFEVKNGNRIINTEQEKNSRAAVIAFLKTLKDSVDFDERQVYLMGFSQGGIMSYSLALTHPDLFKGIAVMSGRLLPEIKPEVAPAEKLKNLRVFIAHGKQDAVLNIDYARTAITYLNELGIHPSFHEYNEGHTISREMLQDVVQWLKSNLTQ